MKEIVELYLNRASKFERDAKFDYEHEDYDLVMFHLEQAFQLLIKAKLLDLKGYFEKTHGLRRLLSDLSQNWKEDELQNFMREQKVVLRNLERAYISSRYYYEEFFPEEVDEAFKALSKLREMLWRE